MKLRYVLPKTINKEAESETGESVITKFPNPGIGIRHLQSLLLALCVFCGYLQRVNLSVTIVAMTKLRKGESNQQETTFPVYDWDNDVRSYLHSSFFIGYLVMNFPAACLGVHFNNKLLLSFSFIINGVLTCLTPFLITYDYTGSNSFILEMKDFAGTGNWRVLVALRAIQGLLQAFMFPTIHAISARWAPPNERGCLVGFILSGIPFGTMIILAGSGLLASNPSLGWPSIFYVGGMMGIVWALLWSWLGSNGPSSHPSISSEEQDYICHNLPPENITSKKNVPWKDILMSPHVWAIVVAHTAHNWGFWLLLSEMPTFLNAVSGFDIKSDGLLSSLPYLGMWCLQFPVMWIADRFNKKGITSITASRKIWTSIGLCGAACSLVALGYLDSNADAALLLYIFAISISCCCNVGFNVNHMDLTSNYAGIIMGLSNAIAATGGFGAPQIVGFLVHDITSVIEWRNAFYAGAAIMFLGNLFYVIFGSGKTQSWNNKTSYTPSTA